MSYNSVRVVVLDERLSSVNDDTISPEDRHLIGQADYVIRITPDRVLSDSNMVDVITPATEATLSLEKAKREFDQRDAKRRPDPPARDGLRKAYVALGNSEDFEPPELPPAS
jgi:hypothetical protein